MPASPSSPEALKKLQLIVAITLGSLFAVSLALALAGVWPATMVEEVLGAPGIRMRIVGTFVVLGVGLLALLLVALAIKKLSRRG